MLFDLNVLIRKADGTWDSSEARKIILFAKYYEMAIDWELGNEPPNFPIIFNLTIAPDQLAKDYNHLKALLISSGYSDSILVGPEVNQVGGPTETSTAYDGGALGISDRFVAGFLWLDKLGYSAKSGIRVVIRQSFFGGNYGMISSDLTPNPDWWISVVFKKFVSNKVLDLLTNNFSKLRLNAHCTQDKALLNGVPATTIFGVNINEISASISIQGVPLLPQSAIFFYALTASNLQSRTIKMNGEDLKLLQNGDLPVFKPIILKTGENIILPAYSMVFLVVHGANVTGCW